MEVDFRNHRATVEAGHVNLKLTQKVQDQGFFFAPDPSSQSACIIGGNVAENSGGPHCLKYGVTTNHVTGIKYVTRDGEMLALGGQALDAPGYDLIGVLIGSEGTMGIITEITVKRLRKPQGVQTVLALFDSVETASTAVSGVIAAVLIIEVDGLKAGLDEQAEAILKVCREAGCQEVWVAQTAEERARWWNNRKTAFSAAGKLAPNYYVQDGVIPRSRLTEVLAEIDAIGKRYDVITANVFHAGDGNLHPLICYDEQIPGIVEKMVRAGSQILAACCA
jgi:FAD/FMN-containing dehydrogenase